MALCAHMSQKNVAEKFSALSKYSYGCFFKYLPCNEYRVLASTDNLMFVLYIALEQYGTFFQWFRFTHNLRSFAHVTSS